MAQFAQLDENNMVVFVTVIDNDILNINGQEVEDAGISYLKNLLGENTHWVQTSYNGNFRKNYAGIGYYYNLELNAFIPPKPFESWLLDEDTCQWQAPIPMPDGNYTWDEKDLKWKLWQP